MPNGINIQGPQPIVLEEPGSLFKELGADVLKGFISEYFYQIRNQKVKETATLWDAYKFQTQTGLKLADPGQVEDAITRLTIDRDNPETPQHIIGGLDTLIDSLEAHHGRLIDNAPAFEAADVRGGFEETRKESLQENSKASKDPDFLRNVSKDIQDSIDDITDENIPGGSKKKEIRDVEEITALLKDLEENQYPEFAKKYLSTTGVPRDDLTEQQVIDMASEQAYLEEYGKTLSDFLDKEVEGVEGYDAVEYLRDVKGDRLLALQLDMLIKDKRLIDQSADVAQTGKDLIISSLQYDRKLDDFRKNPETYGEMSQSLIDEVIDNYTKNSEHIDKTALAILDKMEKERRTILTGYSVLNNIKRVQDGGGLTSDTANEHLDNALSYVNVGLNTENPAAVSQALTSLNKAITEERAWKKGQSQATEKAAKQDIIRQNKEKIELTKSTKGKLTTVASQISEDFGKGTKSVDAKSKYHSDYLEGGKFELNQNLTSMLESFNMRDKTNIELHKLGVGENVAKLVKSSDLPADNKEVNDLVNKAMNLNLSKL